MAEHPPGRCPTVRHGVEPDCADDIDEGSVVLVFFGDRMAMGYVVALSSSLAELPYCDGLDPSKVKPIRGFCPFLMQRYVRTVSF